MRLKELREKMQITQTEVARITEIPVRNYNHYENNMTEPDIETLIKLANFYRTSVDYLIGRDVEQINLEAIKPIKKKLIQYILRMNELEEIKTEAYLDGLMGE